MSPLWWGLWALAIPIANAEAPEPSPEPDAPTEVPSEDPLPELSPEDFAALQEALGADAEVAADPPVTPLQPAAAGARGAAAWQSMNPDISLIGTFAVAAFTSDEPLQTGGHDPQQRGFNLQQLELAVGSSVDPYFRFDGNLVFSQFGVEIEEIYATTLALPFRTQARIGQFLTRFGRHNPTHLHDWHFVDQPFPVGRIFGGEGNRGLGLEGSVLLPLPWYVEVLVSTTEAGGASTARSFFGGDDLGVRGPFDLQWTTAVRQFHPLGDDLGLAWGASMASGPNPTGRQNRSEVYGLDLYLRYRPVTVATYTEVGLHAELFHRRRQVPGDLLLDDNAFAQLQWRFARNWSTAARWEWGGPARAVEGVAADDPLDPSWTADRHRLAASLTYQPTEFSRIRGQISRDEVGWRDTPDHAAFLAFEFAVGAHGAHPF